MEIIWKLLYYMATYWWVFGLLFGIAGGAKLFATYAIHII